MVKGCFKVYLGGCSHKFPWLTVTFASRPGGPRGLKCQTIRKLWPLGSTEIGFEVEYKLRVYFISVPNDPYCMYVLLLKATYNKSGSYCC